MVDSNPKSEIRIMEIFGFDIHKDFGNPVQALSIPIRQVFEIRIAFISEDLLHSIKDRPELVPYPRK